MLTFLRQSSDDKEHGTGHDDSNQEVQEEPENGEDSPGRLDGQRLALLVLSDETEP